VRSPHHGHVEAVLTALRLLGFARLLARQPSRERELVVAMVVARILWPGSKLATQVDRLRQRFGIQDQMELPASC
jgi:hypothetical protein